MIPLIVDQQTFTANRIFCVGRNYVAHAQELKNEVPDTPVIFMKPVSALVLPDQSVPFPAHGADLHHEVEVVILIGQAGRAHTPAEAASLISGLTLGLDLTLRDVQNKLKTKGLPWELAKAFDASAMIGHFTPYTPAIDLTSLSFACHVNNELRQQGCTDQMIFPIQTLLVFISSIWQLQPGDLIYTGTPAGVGPLKPGDQITISADWAGRFSWNIR